MSARALILELHSRSLRQCRYCYYRALPKALRPHTALPSGELCALAIGAARAGAFAGIMLSGGEPLLHPDCFDVIAELRAQQLGVALISDAESISDAEARELARLGIWMLQPTLLAADAGRHDRLKGEGSFAATLRGMEALLRAKVPISLSFVCTSENAEQWLPVLELAIGMGIERVAFSRLALSSTDETLRRLHPSRAQVVEALDIAVRCQTLLGLRIELAIAIPADLRPHALGLAGGTCAAMSPNPGFCIDPIGRVRNCALSAEILGDLRTQSWNEVLLAHQTQRRKRSLHVSGHCSGGCVLSAEHSDGQDPLCAPESASRERTAST
ncbi:MAG: radical SAM protein [Myxococcota bacterium]|nr:radical SAM protein [Myxococcota bacterium]